MEIWNIHSSISYWRPWAWTLLCCLRLVQSGWSYLFFFSRMCFPSGDCGFTHFSLFAIVILGERRRSLVRESLNNVEEWPVVTVALFSSFTHIISKCGQKILGGCTTGSVLMSCVLILPTWPFKHLHFEPASLCPVGRKDTTLLTVSQQTFECVCVFQCLVRDRAALEAESTICFTFFSNFYIFFIFQITFFLS